MDLLKADEKAILFTLWISLISFILFAIIVLCFREKLFSVVANVTLSDSLPSCSSDDDTTKDSLEVFKKAFIILKK